jgi:nucleolar complex protein 2
LSGEDDDDNASFASVDDLDDGESSNLLRSAGLIHDTDDEGKRHLMELSELAEKDPEFFKYLQENDRELLNFNAEAMAEDDDTDEDEDRDVDMEDEEQVPTLTKQLLQKWQKALLEVLFEFYVPCLHQLTTRVAKLAQSSAKTAGGLPVSSTHERG